MPWPFSVARKAVSIVIPTDEELMIAWHTAEATKPQVSVSSSGTSVGSA